MHTSTRSIAGVVGMVLLVASSVTGCGGATSGDADATISGDAAVVSDAAVDASNPCVLDCPEPTASHNTVCGRVIDLATGTALEVEGGGVGTLCEDIPVEERTGPCLLAIEPYDLLSYAQNPGGTSPSPADEIVVNDCGWYRVVNVPTPALGWIGVLLDDSDPGRDDWAASLVGVGQPAGIVGEPCPVSSVRRVLPVVVAPGDRLEDVDVMAISNQLVIGWTNTAGDPFGGATFAAQGVALMRFVRNGIPVAGVTVTDQPSDPVPADDYYFADSEESGFTTVVPSDPGCEVGPGCQPFTGPNGAALMVVDSGLACKGGIGALPPECAWQRQLAKARGMPGVVWTMKMEAVTIDGHAPCL